MDISGLFNNYFEGQQTIPKGSTYIIDTYMEVPVSSQREDEDIVGSYKMINYMSKYTILHISEMMDMI